MLIKEPNNALFQQNNVFRGNILLLIKNLCVCSSLFLYRICKIVYDPVDVTHKHGYALIEAVERLTS